MARKYSGKKTTKDDNTLRQLQGLSGLEFWNKELSARKFHLDIRNSQILEMDFCHNFEILLLAIYYKRVQPKLSFEETLSQQLLISFHDKGKKPDWLYQEYDNHLEYYQNEIVIVMDTFLNFTEKEPTRQLLGRGSCDKFYIEYITYSLNKLKEISLTYGLYPHQLLLTTPMDEILLLYPEVCLINNESQFLKIPSETPPVVFKHQTLEECFFETEVGNKFYYYCVLEKDMKIKQLLEDLKVKLSEYTGGNGVHSNDRSDQGQYAVQICIDVNHCYYKFSLCMDHVEFELKSCYFFYFQHIQSLELLKRISKEGEVASGNESLNKIEKERECVQLISITQGGHGSRMDNLSRAVGTFIWDIEQLYNIPNKDIEAFLASDTKNHDLVVSKINNSLLEQFAGRFIPDFVDQLDTIKGKLHALKYNCTRKALNQDYKTICRLIDRQLRHHFYINC